MSFMNNFQLYGKLEELSAKNVQNLDLINSSILVAILDDSSPETDADLIKVVLGGSGNFGDFWPEKNISFVATKNGLLGSQAEVSHQIYLLLNVQGCKLGSYIWVCLDMYWLVWVCLCVCEREREIERQRVSAQ